MSGKDGSVGHVAIRNARAEELGVDPSILEAESRARRQSITDVTVTADGSFTVLGIDRFDDEHWIHQRYRGSNAHEEALFEARRLTAEGMKRATAASVAVVYYAYDPRGNYLGGDTWKRE